MQEEDFEDPLDDLALAKLEDLSGVSSPSVEPASSDTGSLSTDSATQARRKPIPRKGHRKSRRGCLQCKRRKVKCQETLPECGHCVRLGLACEYPRAQSYEMVPAPAGTLQPTPTLFTMEDLRFFQHFLVTAYPPLPLRGDAIWKDVATISHGYDYLIHAMLGLAASHLDLCSEGSFSAPALTHRVTAIKLLNEALGRPCTSKAEGDARFAAMMALTFQASYLADGMIEFLSMTRGCQVVAASSIPDLGESLFRSFSREGHMSTVRTMVSVLDPLKALDAETVVTPFLTSLRALAPLCQSTLQLGVLASLERVARLSLTSTVEAFADMATLYGVLAEATNEEFIAFTADDNHVSRLLLIHFFLIEYATGFLALGSDNNFLAKKVMNPVWLERLVNSVPMEYEKYLAWPRECHLSMMS
ncbi:hypothetical protein GQ53DRAFT_726027 [Thozetella sp. PMI_491]|nr:hypothetical protein GQ53DRAFT_726027 [Thozetella sp. PMI_491]